MIPIHGKDYTVGNINDLVGTSSGGSIDWALFDSHIKYSLAIELRDTGA